MVYRIDSSHFCYFKINSDNTTALSSSCIHRSLSLLVFLSFFFFFFVFFLSFFPFCLFQSFQKFPSFLFLFFFFFAFLSFFLFPFFPFFPFSLCFILHLFIIFFALLLGVDSFTFCAHTHTLNISTFISLSLGHPSLSLARPLSCPCLSTLRSTILSTLRETLRKIIARSLDTLTRSSSPRNSPKLSETLRNSLSLLETQAKVLVRRERLCELESSLASPERFPPQARVVSRRKVFRKFLVFLCVGAHCPFLRFSFSFVFLRFPSFSFVFLFFLFFFFLSFLLFSLFSSRGWM